MAWTLGSSSRLLTVPAIRLQLDDGVDAVLNQGPEAALTLRQELLGPLLGRDVLVDRHDRNDLAGGISNRAGADQRPALLTRLRDSVADDRLRLQLTPQRALARGVLVPHRATGLGQDREAPEDLGGCRSDQLVGGRGA